MPSTPYLCRQLIHSNAVHLQTVKHELWRVESVESEGLTPKQLAHLRKTNRLIAEATQRLTDLGTHLQKRL